MLSDNPKSIDKLLDYLKEAIISAKEAEWQWEQESISEAEYLEYEIDVNNLKMEIKALLKPV